MNNKSILITGATGTGGGALLQYLHEKYSNATFYAQGRSIHSQKLSSTRVHYKLFNLTDSNKTHELIQQIKPDIVFHLASDARVLNSFHEPEQTLANNILGTNALLEACRLYKPDTRFVLSSTSEVYGQVKPEEVPIGEQNQIRPASPYAVSKTTQDLLTQVYIQSYKLPATISRMFTYINPWRRDLFASSFAYQIAEIEAGKRDKLLHGNLKSVRTFMDIDDAVHAYELLATKAKLGEIYNIGGKESYEVGEFLDVLISMANTKISHEQDPKLLRPTDVTLQIPNTDKFYRDTGWTTKVSLEQSLQKLLNFARKQISS